MVIQAGFPSSEPILRQLADELQLSGPIFLYLILHSLIPSLTLVDSRHPDHE